MTVRVLFFASLREMFGVSETRMRLPEGASIGDAMDELARGEAGLRGLPLLFAVNETFETETRALRDGDTLALMTPVSGG